MQRLQSSRLLPTPGSPVIRGARMFAETAFVMMMNSSRCACDASSPSELQSQAASGAFQLSIRTAASLGEARTARFHRQMGLRSILGNVKKLFDNIGVYGLAFMTLFWTSPYAGPAVVVLLIAGGVCYIAGAVCYALRRPDPWPRVFGFHEIFHCGTVAGYACHMVAIYMVIVALWGAA